MLNNKLIKYIALLALCPIEYIALSVDYYTYTMWGYIPFLLVIVLTIIYAKNLDGLVIVASLRLLGAVISFILINLSSEVFILTGYFKPLTTVGLSTTLSGISIVIIIVSYMYKKIGFK